MNSSPDVVAPLRIEAVLCDGERHALLSAIEDLRQCVAEGSGCDFPIEVYFHSALSAIAPTSGPALVVTSLLLEFTGLEEPLTVVAERLRRAFEKLNREGISKIFLCTVFRRVDRRNNASNSVAILSLMERIRRLNLLAAQLSHELDINIIDFDRSLAHIGGRALDADFRLQGAAAVEAAKYDILSTFFAAGLDDFCSPELQEKSKAVYEQRRSNSFTQARHELSATRLGYRQAHYDKAHQTYAVSPRLPRTLGDLWLDLRKRRVSVGETLLTLLRAARRRLLRRLNRTAL